MAVKMLALCLLMTMTHAIHLDPEAKSDEVLATDEPDEAEPNVTPLTKKFDALERELHELKSGYKKGEGTCAKTGEAATVAERVADIVAEKVAVEKPKAAKQKKLKKDLKKIKAQERDIFCELNSVDADKELMESLDEKTELDLLKKKSSALHIKIAPLKRQREDIQRRLTLATKRVAWGVKRRWDVKRRWARGRLHPFSVKYTQALNEIDTLEQKVENMKKDIARLVEKGKGKSAECKQLNEDLILSQKNLKDALTNGQNLNKQVASLTEEVASLTEQQEEFEGVLQESFESFKAKKEALVQARAEVKRLDEEVTVAYDIWADAMKGGDAAEIANESLMGKREELKAAKNTMKDAAKAVEVAVGDFLVEIEEMLTDEADTESASSCGN